MAARAIVIDRDRRWRVGLDHAVRISFIVTVAALGLLLAFALVRS